MENENKIPTQLDNPKGLHQRYIIKKLKIVKNPQFGLSSTSIPYGKRRVESEFLVKETPVDKNAEYFALRLDTGCSDINHIKACRIGIHAYADAIEATIPQLAKDLKERYPLLP